MIYNTPYLLLVRKRTYQGNKKGRRSDLFTRNANYSSSFAFATTLSTVKPNSSNSSSAGADSP
ncbi:hypothetical protein, partial [Acinetobacter baumannii]|uniref:hypothetical protein n=1 Tax=Acinetobacter baumannii TaxID=470 RepID=UPI0031F4223D